ncbi:unnamed protein product [Sympodiomycopsis kandeliae]
MPEFGLSRSVAAAEALVDEHRSDELIRNDYHYQNIEDIAYMYAGRYDESLPQNLANDVSVVHPKRDGPRAQDGEEPDRKRVKVEQGQKKGVGLKDQKAVRPIQRHNPKFHILRKRKIAKELGIASVDAEEMITLPLTDGLEAEPVPEEMPSEVILLVKSVVLGNGVSGRQTELEEVVACDAVHADLAEKLGFAAKAPSEFPSLWIFLLRFQV